MSSGLFKNVINKTCLEIMYLMYMYKNDLALNDLQWLKDRNLTGTTTPGQSWPRSNGNERVLHIFQKSKNGSLTIGAVLLLCWRILNCSWLGWNNSFGILDNKARSNGNERILQLFQSSRTRASSTEDWALLLFGGGGTVDVF